MERKEASLLLDLLIKLYHMDGGTLHRVNGFNGNGPPLLITARGWDTMQEIIEHLFESNLVDHLHGLRQERQNELCLDLALIGSYFPGVKPLLHSRQVKSLLLTPLFHREQLVGVLAVFGKNYTALEGGDMELLASISGRLGFILKDLEIGVESLPRPEARAGWRLPTVMESLLRISSGADSLDDCISNSLELLADGLHAGMAFAAFDDPLFQHSSFHSHAPGHLSPAPHVPSREFSQMASTLRHITVVKPESPVMTSLPACDLAVAGNLQALLVPVRDDDGAAMLACLYLQPEQRLTREEMESLHPLVFLLLNQARSCLSRQKEVARLKALDILTDLAGELSSYEGDSQDMGMLANKCLEVFGCDRAAVVMLDEARGVYETVVRNGADVRGDDFSLVHNPHIAAVLREGCPLRDVDEENGEAVNRDGHPRENLMILPLLGRESLLGVLVLEKRGGFSGSGDLSFRLAQALAGQAAMLLEGHRERQSMSFAADEVDFLSLLNRRVFSAASFAELGAALYEELNRQLGAEFLLIAWPGRTSAVSGWQYGQPIDTSPFEDLYHPQSAVFRSLASNGFYRNGNLSASMHSAGERTLARMHMRSCAAVRLHDESGSSGLLMVAGPGPNSFGKSGLARLEQAAEAVSSASRLPILYDRLEKEYGRLSEAHDQLEEVISVQGDLLHIAAHEIRSPLTLIMGFAEVIRDYYDGMQSGERNQVVDRLLRSVDRLRRSVINMLELSRLESGQFSVQAEHFDLRALLDELLEEFKPRSIPCELELVTSGDHGRIFADRDKIEIVLFNLIDNAIKFSQPGSRITVASRNLPGHTVLEVSDHGRGISSEYIDAVFEPFERGEEAKRVSAQGMGLGLYIVKKLVEAHGGEIRLRTMPGEGSTFTITLPQDGMADGSEDGVREALRA